MARVLIVDDDRDLVEGQKLFLESKGYEVETAYSMKEGIDKLENFKPDVIIADLMMEHYDSGFVFCKKVRENPDLKDVPIIMQTSSSRKAGFTFDVKDPSKKKWIKADEVLVKPVPFDLLVGKIENYLKDKNPGGGL